MNCPAGGFSDRPRPPAVSSVTRKLPWSWALRRTRCRKATEFATCFVLLAEFIWFVSGGWSAKWGHLKTQPQQNQVSRFSAWVLKSTEATITRLRNALFSLVRQISLTMLDNAWHVFVLKQYPYTILTIGFHWMLTLQPRRLSAPQGGFSDVEDPIYFVCFFWIWSANNTSWNSQYLIHSIRSLLLFGDILQLRDSNSFWSSGADSKSPTLFHWWRGAQRSNFSAAFQMFQSVHWNSKLTG